MKTISIEYADQNQKLIGTLFFNGAMGEKKLPAIILFPAFEGPSEFAFDYAKNIAEKGCAVFVADMYGDAAVGKTLPECIQLFMPFSKDRALVRRRAILALDAVLKQKNIDADRIGTIGFCFGGMCALELARSGANIKSTVSVHGMLSKSALPVHPIHGKILLLHGYQDPQVPPSELPRFAQEMKDTHAHDWTIIYFGEARHSYSDIKTGTFDAIKEKEMGREYHPIAAARTARYINDFFNETLFQKTE